MTASVETAAALEMLLGFEYDEARHGQFGIKEIELSKASEYRGRQVHAGLHRHYIHKQRREQSRKQ